MLKAKCWIAGMTVAFLLALPVAARADDVKSAGKEFARKIKPLKGHTVAVLPFGYPDGLYSSGSWSLSERLTTVLAGYPPVEVVERSRLPDLLGEMKLEISGALKTQSAPPWGSVLPVDALVIGTLIDQGNAKTEVNVRLIDIRSGRVLSARTFIVKRTWTDQPSKEKAPPWALEAMAQESESPTRTQQIVTSLLVEPVDETGTPLPDLDTLIRSPVLPMHVMGIIRRVYTRSPDPEERARALYGLGIVCERHSQYTDAAAVYHQLISEFPQQSHRVSDATGRLWGLQVASR